MTELLPEFSSSAYLTDTQLSRLKRIPAEYKSYLTSGKDWKEAVHQLHRY